MLRAGVAHHIGERLLGYPEAFGFNDSVKPAMELHASEASLKTRDGGLSVGEPTQGSFKSQIVQHRRPQIERKIMDLLEHAFNCLDAFLETPGQPGLSRSSERRLEVHLRDCEALADFVVQF